MPFKSKAQVGYMFVHHPEIAKEFAHETPSIKNLPEHVGTTRGGQKGGGKQRHLDALKRARKHASSR